MTGLPVAERAPARVGVAAPADAREALERLARWMIEVERPAAGEFLPAGERETFERYYLALQRRTFREAPLQLLLAAMRSREFLDGAARLPGYDATNAGSREALTAALTWLKQPRPRKRAA